jgi:integrase
MSARPLSDEEYARMVEFLGVAGRQRDRLLLVLGCGTGYRITELLSLTIAQVWDGKAARKEVLVARRNLKGGSGAHCRSVRSRRVPLSAKIQELVAEYVASLAATASPEAALFPTDRSGRAAMNRSSAFRMLTRTAKDCGIDERRVSTHCLRKTFVARAYRATGCDLIKTQRIVGHRSPMTTARYLETDQSELDELVRTLAA